MTKKLFRILSALMAAAFLLSACSGTRSTDTEEKEPLQVAWGLWPGWYPMAIAMEKGFFEKHGVQVEPQFFVNYSEQKSLLASGAIDGSAMVLGDVLLDTIAKDVKVIMIIDNSDGADQVIGGPDVAGPQDARGKRIGVQPGTFGNLLIFEMLAQNGISPSEVSFVEVPPEDVPGAIPSLIDIGFSYEPFTSEARSKGYDVIFSSADAPGLLVDVFAFRKAVVEERPEDMRAFIKAWFEAVQYWQANPEEGNAIIAKAAGLDVKEISIEGVMMFGLAENLSAFKPGNDTTSIYFSAGKNLQFLIDTGVISSPVKIDELLDASFLQ